MLATAVAAKELQTERRNPRLFWVSSSTTTSTSTISTTTMCYTAANLNAITACAANGRRKRSIITDPITGVKVDLVNYVDPSATSKNKRDIREVEEELEKDIESGKDELKDEDGEGRFLLYWYTSTTTSTTSTTSFTATSYISVSCTPSSFTMSVCG